MLRSIFCSLFFLGCWSILRCPDGLPFCLYFRVHMRTLSGNGARLGGNAICFFRCCKKNFSFLGFRACENGWLEAVSHMWQADGSWAMWLDENRCTSLMLAVKNGFAEFFFAVCSSETYTVCVFGSHASLVTFLVRVVHVSLNARDASGWTALHHAVSANHLQVFRCPQLAVGRESGQCFLSNRWLSFCFRLEPYLIAASTHRDMCVVFFI